MSGADGGMPGKIPPEAIAGQERGSLMGLNVVVTGGNRDIGAAIALSFANEGGNVFSSYRNKPDKADGVKAAIDPTRNGSLTFITTDLSTDDGRGQFSQEALAHFGGRKINVLVLSTSGPTPALNRELSMNLITSLLPNMDKGGTVVRMQSVPGKYNDQLQGTGKMLVGYDDVAASKSDDLRAIRERTSEMAEHGVRFIEVTAPVVPDTSNMRLFNGQARREARRAGIPQGQISETPAQDAHDEISVKLGLPKAVSSAEIGAKVVQLVKNPNIPTGYTELFGDVEDAQTMFEGVYGRPEVYVQTLERTGGIEGRKMGTGRSIVSIDQAERTGEPESFIDALRVDTEGEFVGVVTVTPDHAKGHFKPESGLPRILPGHKQIRAAIDTIEAIEQSNGTAASVRLRSFASVKFETAVVADGATSLHVRAKQNERIVNGASYDVEIVRDSDDATVATMKDVRVQISQEEPNKKGRLLEDQLVEGMAQAAGATYLEGSVDGMPLFAGLGETAFYEDRLKAGDDVRYFSTTAPEGKRGFSATLDVRSGDKIIARTSDLEATVIPSAIVKRRFKQ